MSEEVHYRTILDLEYDPRKARETQRAVQGARGDLRELADEASLADRVFDRLGQQGGTLGDVMDDATRQVNDMNDALAATRRNAESADNALGNIQQPGMRGSGGGGNLMGRSERALSSVAALAGGSAVSEAMRVGADVLQVVETFKDLRRELQAAKAGGETTASTLSGLAGVLGGAGGLALAGVAAAGAVAVGALALAVNSANTAMEGARNAANAYADAVRLVNEEYDEYTTRQAKDALARVQADLAAARTTLSEQQAAQTSEWEHLRDETLGGFGMFSDAAARIGTALTSTAAEEYADDIEATNKRIEDLEAQEVALGRTLLEGRTRENDARETQIKVEQDLIESARRAAQTERERASILKTTANPETIRQQIAASDVAITSMERQIATLRAQGGTSITVAEEIAQVEAALQQERETNTLLRTEVLGAAQANQDAADAAAALKKQEDDLAKARERDAGIYARALDAFISYQESLRDIQEQKQDDIETAWADYYNALANENAQFQKAQQDLAARAGDEAARLVQEQAVIHREAGDELLAAVERHNADMAKLHRQRQQEERWLFLDHAAQLHDLAVERNVAGFVAQMRQYQRDQQHRAEEARIEDQDRRARLEDEKAAIRERQDARLRANAEALAALDARTAEEQARLEQAHQDRLAEIDAAQDEELQKIEQAAQAQAQAREIAFNQQLADLNRQLSTETETRERYYAEWNRQAASLFSEFRGLAALSGGGTRLGQDFAVRTSQGVSHITGEGGKIVVNQVVGELVSAPQAKQIADKTANAILSQQQRWEQQRRRWR